MEITEVSSDFSAIAVKECVFAKQFHWKRWKYSINSAVP